LLDNTKFFRSGVRQKEFFFKSKKGHHLEEGEIFVKNIHFKASGKLMFTTTTRLRKKSFVRPGYRSTND
jgi:hypothetical protein